MRILIVEDHPIVRAGLRRLLSLDPQTEIWEATSGKEALSIFKARRPDLVILDLNLPGIGGLEVIGRLKADDAAVRILVLSVHDNALYVTRAMQAGAIGYVSKGAPPDEILEAVKRVAAGRPFIEQSIAQELALLNIRRPSDPLKELSRRELGVLRLLGGGCTLAQIAETMGVSHKTIVNNCTQIKAKLGVERTADLIRIAVLHGITESHAGLTAHQPDDHDPPR
jgi:two-component system, NarL family, invasion response regulator UvrY